MTGQRPVAGIAVPYRVRFDEGAPDGLARSSALLRYAADVAWVHSERLGFGRDWYAERGLAWVIRSAELMVLQPIPTGASLTISTAVTGFRKVWARRRTEARDDGGGLAFWAHSDYVMLGATGLPVRVPAEFPAAFSVPPEGFDPVRVELPPTPDGAVGFAFAVRPQDLDPMGHVNNAAYLDYFEEAVLAADPGAAAELAAVPRHVRLEYAIPAEPGMRLVGTAWSPGGPVRRAFRLVDPDGRELFRAILMQEVVDT